MYDHSKDLFEMFMTLQFCYSRKTEEYALQANLIITLSLGSIKTDRVISEPCYNEVTYYRHIAK